YSAKRGKRVIIVGRFEAQEFERERKLIVLREHREPLLDDVPFHAICLREVREEITQHRGVEHATKHRLRAGIIPTLEDDYFQTALGQDVGGHGRAWTGSYDRYIESFRHLSPAEGLWSMPVTLLR